MMIYTEISWDKRIDYLKYGFIIMLGFLSKPQIRCGGAVDDNSNITIKGVSISYRTLENLVDAAKEVEHD